jgi:hypothetical protein
VLPNMQKMRRIARVRPPAPEREAPPAAPPRAVHAEPPPAPAPLPPPPPRPWGLALCLVAALTAAAAAAGAAGMYALRAEAARAVCVGWQVHRCTGAPVAEHGAQPHRVDRWPDVVITHVARGGGKVANGWLRLRAQPHRSGQQDVDGAGERWCLAVPLAAVPSLAPTLPAGHPSVSLGVCGTIIPPASRDGDGTCPPPPPLACEDARLPAAVEVCNLVRNVTVEVPVPVTITLPPPEPPQHAASCLHACLQLHDGGYDVPGVLNGTVPVVAYWHGAGRAGASGQGGSAVGGVFT